jgi:hypothetical protein
LKNRAAGHQGASQGDGKYQEPEVFEPFGIRERLVTEKRLPEPKKTPGEEVVELDGEGEQRKEKRKP